MIRIKMSEPKIEMDFVHEDDLENKNQIIKTLEELAGNTRVNFQQFIFDKSQKLKDMSFLTYESGSVFETFDVEE